MRANDCEFTIVKHIATLKTYETGYTKELNVVSQNGQIPKYDIRDWDPNHKRMGKGITLGPDEIKKLVDGYTKYSKSE